MNPHLTVAVTSGDGYVVIALAGDLDLGSVDEPRALLFQSINDQQPRLVVIDCADLTFLDSSGLGAFVAARQQLEGVGGRLALANLGASVGKPVRLTGLHKSIHVHWRTDQPVRPWADAGASLADVARGVHIEGFDVPAARPAQTAAAPASMSS